MLSGSHAPEKHISLHKNTFRRSQGTKVQTTPLNLKFQKDTPFSCPSLLRFYTFFTYSGGIFPSPQKHKSLQKNTLGQRYGIWLPQTFNEPSTQNYPSHLPAFTVFTFVSTCIHDFHATSRFATSIREANVMARATNSRRRWERNRSSLMGETNSWQALPRSGSSLLLFRLWEAQNFRPHSRTAKWIFF